MRFITAWRNHWKYLCSPVKKKWCYSDFLYYHMQEMDRKSQKEMLTPEELRHYEQICNADAGRRIFNDKREFYRHFSAYMKREIFFPAEHSQEEFAQFLAKHEKIILKPQQMYAGFGIVIVAAAKTLQQEGISRTGQQEASSARVADNQALTAEEKLYRYLFPAGITRQEALENYDLLVKYHYLAEEYLQQAEPYRKMNSSSLNTVRLTTLIGREGSAQVLAAANQFGSGGSITDNDDRYGIWADIDLETGCVDAVETDAITGEVREYHPDSGQRISGFQNPRFADMKQLVCRAAMEVPSCRLIGWDVALTKEGSLELLEGNVTPELELFQVMTGRGFRSILAKEVL